MTSRRSCSGSRSSWGRSPCRTRATRATSTRRSTTWTGISYETSAAIFYATAVVLGIAYLAAFVLAVVGIVRGRRVAS